MDDLTGQTLLNRYKVCEKVGHGGMAEVYRVVDETRGVDLAMKVLHEDLAEDVVFLRRFKREALTLSRLQHPNIVRFYGIHQTDDLVFILMDFVDGPILRKEISRKKRPFSMTEILEIMRPVCSAVAFAHSMGLIHCDLKPANIMIHKNGTVVVTDFGISRMSDAATATLVGVGTPAFMAPEQVRGLDPTPQTDIYALGIVLYEMLTGGQRPFTGENATVTGTNSGKVRWEQVNLQAPSPKAVNPAIPQVLEAIVLKCLEKDPACRYSNPLDLLKDLSGVQGDTYVPPVMPPILPEEAEQTPLSPTVKVPAIGTEQPQLTRAITPKKMILFSAIGLVFLIIIGIVIFGKGGKPIPTPLPTVAQSEGRDVQAAAFVDKPTSTMIATQVNTATFTPSPTITFTLPPSNTPLPALTSTPTISFPDTFEDNHNGWNLDRVFNIVEGRIQAINLGERSTDWISCAGCEVTIGSGKVSVDMMWSYSEIHETAWQYTGLLLDDGTCSTVPIVFTLFYGNLNGTPYPSFELREMEPSQKSEYSFWFRYSTPKVKPGGIIKINRSPKEDINNMAAAYKRDIHGGLLIELYINGQYAWGTSVRTYNNSPVCRPGLFMFTTKIFFDNFNIEQ